MRLSRIAASLVFVLCLGVPGAGSILASPEQSYPEDRPLKQRPPENDIYGKWRSSTGSVFHIREVGRRGLVLKVKYRNGQWGSLRGHWVKGQEGRKFKYYDVRMTYTGTFKSDDPDRIKIQSGTKTSFWKRIGGN
jgi:hypothetical protein